jgi:hypothetical protein
MNKTIVDQIVEAVLYEGYMLYPYRPSVKNHQRWTFGGLFPRTFSEMHKTLDAWAMQTECLLRGSEQTKLAIEVRFLHLIERIEKPQEKVPSENPDQDHSTPCGSATSQNTGGRPTAWQEAEERVLLTRDLPLSSLVEGTIRREFRLSPRILRAAFAQSSGAICEIERRQMGLLVLVEASAKPVADGLFQLRVRIENHTPLENAGGTCRDDAQKFSLASTHCVLAADGGEFVSLIDPPDDDREFTSRCQNIGVWPVLVGEPDQRNTILASPIILYDYPQIAPESPGNLFDSTEIDEILTLRILTLTDKEKQAAALTDERTRTLLERTETLARDQLVRLHGRMRGLQVVGMEESHDR